VTIKLRTVRIDSALTIGAQGDGVTNVGGLIMESPGFSPRLLFIGGFQGAWFDPSDASTVFTDTAGTTPASIGQAVARINDKSGNGNHATQATPGARPIWARVPSGGRRNILTSTDQFVNPPWGVSAVGTGAVAPSVTTNNATAPDGSATADTVVFNSGGSLSGDRSLLRYSPSIDTPAATYTGSIWLRGTVGGEQLVFRHVAAVAYQTVTLSTSWQRFSNVEVPFSGGGTNRFEFGVRHPNVSNVTATVEVWGAQLEAGSVLTDYQRVVTAFDVTETGVKSVNYLFNDLSDDAINWTAPNDSYAVARAGANGAIDIAAGVALNGATDVLGGAQASGYLAINRALTATEQARLSAYLAAKSGSF
jgi:phage baseplate assembly protein gpV